MAGDRERRCGISRTGRGLIALSYTARFVIVSGMDDEPQWREIARALEYWVIGGLVAGSMVYGIYIGIRDLIAMLF